MGYFYLVTHLSTNPMEQGLTLLSGKNIFDLENNIFQGK